ncbi:MAG TPA: cellulase family glycosylhydrolase [Gaiellaceae bacterium]|nr:cellulase family glycosylhydrolase [Gaiellaceae bacterium]
MRNTLRLVLVLFAASALAAPSALAAERMWIGFHDDPSFRWVDDRASRIESSASQGASVMRLLVHWDRTAPSRPSRPADPFDPAYRFDDLDDAIRTAQAYDMEVLLSLVGTPRWANGGKAPNVMPRRLGDFTSFARAIASRYSGRFEGYPFVRFWSIWNEPNLQVFLAPQFDRRGRSVAPRNYARLYAAGYTGVKAGNRRALVGIGETSARGTDNPRGIRPVHSPGRFVEALARANPRLKFDAWAHHPYPFRPNLKPSQKVRWPNVTLGSLPELERNLARLFKRKRVPIWVTEYGHETRPQDAFGVPYSKQGAYVRQAISIARKNPFVTMFIWFVYQDDPGQPWDSGLYTQTGINKGASPSRFAAAARPLDVRNALLLLRRGTAAPSVKLYARRFCVVDAPGDTIGVTWRVRVAGRLVDVGQAAAPLQADCTIDLRLRGFAATRKNVSYVATFELNDINGELLTRRVTMRAS